jgi:co-chaperonin GroES (HSP10)
MIRPTANNVLILPDKDISGAQGLSRNKWTYAVTGTVVAVPERLMCFHKEVAGLKGGGIHPSQLLRAGDMAQNSLDVDTECEISVGDKVFFPYLCQNETPVVINGTSHLMINYGALICKDDLYPLNSYLIVKMNELDPEYFSYKDMNDYGMAEVVSAGKLWKDRSGDTGDPGVSEGDTVMFERNRCVRLEADEFQTLNVGAQSSFFRVKRQDIVMYSKY